MSDKSIDSEVLAALHVLSKDSVDGINYQTFVKQNIMNGVLDLIDRGYASKIKIEEDNANYRITDKGKEYLKVILQYASEKF